MAVRTSRTIEPLPLDETFEREYDIEWLRDMPSSPHLVRYGSGGGPILRVTPRGGTPFIVVVPGQAGSLTLSTWPNPRQFAVFNWHEMPVIIDIDRPYEPVEITTFKGHGLRATYRFPRHGVVVMASCCDLVGYGAAGEKWGRRDLFCCEQRILDRTEDLLIVDGHLHGGPDEGRRLIDVRSGTVIR